MPTMFSTFSRAFRYRFPHLNIHAVLKPCHLANLSMITAGQLSVSVRVCFLRVCEQAEQEKEVISAVAACSELFSALLERKELFLGKLPGEEDALSG